MHIYSTIISSVTFLEDAAKYVRFLFDRVLRDYGNFVLNFCDGQPASSFDSWFPKFPRSGPVK